jgi:glycosyltransferase involved in cell wall biosynthesis
MKQSPAALRIALVASSLNRAGAEKQFVYLARALRTPEVDATVFYLSDGGFYEDVLRREQVPICKISHPGRPFKILFKLTKALWALKPHIVLAGQFCDICHAALAGRFHRTLTVGGIRSDGLWEVGINGWRSGPMLHLPHALITNSLKARSNLTTLGLNPDKLFLLQNVIDLKDFDARNAEPHGFSIPQQRLIALAAGRLHPDKRFERFLKALALARQKVPELFGVLAGRDDGAKAHLVGTAQELGLLPNHLLFAGECANLPALLARANLLLLSSDSEGVPNVVLEAMAARLPVITTPAGDAPHLVQHGKSGLVVDFNDIAGMAQAMVDLANSPSLRFAMGEAGRQRVESEYEFNSLKTRALRLFQSIAEKRRNKPLLRAIRALAPDGIT